MQAPVGTLISFATQPRSVALDGDDGHSPYTSALAQAMQRPGSGCSRPQRSRACGGESNRRRAIAVAVLLADIGNFLFRRQARDGGCEANAGYAGANRTG